MTPPEAPLRRQLPEKYRDAILQFASFTGLDADALLAGSPFDYKELRYRFESYGAMDPNGFFVLVEVGQVPDGADGSLCRRLLELNMMVPAARYGYYAVLPSTDTIMFCLRVDLATTADPVDTVGTLMEMVHAQMEKTREQLESAAASDIGIAANAVDLA